MRPESFPISAEFDKPHDKCGIVGIYGQSDTIAHDTHDALFELWHRGGQAAGITVFDSQSGVTSKEPAKRSGLWPDINLDGFGPGHIGVGHARYQTVDTQTGDELASIQPLSDKEHRFVVAHNGNFTHFDSQWFAANGSSDTAHLVKLISDALDSQLNPYLPDAIAHALKRTDGAYSLVVADKQQMIAARDPRGFRPLFWGRRQDGSVVAASESVALDALEVDNYEFIEPGQMLIVDANGARLQSLADKERGAFCMMELVYFSRPDTMYGAESVYTKRVRSGIQLAIEQPADVDVVIGVPGTGLDAAEGFADYLGLPLANKGIHKKGYERSFLGRTDEERRAIAKRKFNITRDVVEGKRLAVVDDSLIRGTVTSEIVRKLRRFGAKEVHFRVASPRYINTCHFGIDTGRESELIARRMSIEQTAQHVGADSLAYLSLDGLKQALKYDLDELCDACVSGHYPIPVPVQIGRAATQIAI